MIKHFNVKGESVAVIFGGRGFEREVSVRGAMRFLREADSIGITVIPVFIDPSGDFFIWSGDPAADGDISSRELIPASPMRSGVGGLFAGGEFIPIRLAIPILHGDMGEDGVIQGMLSALGIPYLGAETVCGAVCADKVYTKAVAAAFGIKTLPFALITRRMSFDEISAEAKRIGYPCFLKPCRLGSSVGAAVIADSKKLGAAVEMSFAFSDRLMIEPLLADKRELECAYYSVGKRRIISPPGEVVCRGFYDYSLKYSSDSTVEICPVADLPTEIADRIISSSDILARALSVRHMARFDYFLDGEGDLYFNEINTLPGMTEGSLYPLMLEALGVSFTELVRDLCSEDPSVW